jgi:hypothetical protein
VAAHLARLELTSDNSRPVRIVFGSLEIGEQMMRATISFMVWGDRSARRHEDRFVFRTCGLEMSSKDWPRDLMDPLTVHKQMRGTGVTQNVRVPPGELIEHSIEVGGARRGTTVISILFLHVDHEFVPQFCAYPEAARATSIERGCRLGAC